jgi:hypothetical protein
MVVSPDAGTTAVSRSLVQGSWARPGRHSQVTGAGGGRVDGVVVAADVPVGEVDGEDGVEVEVVPAAPPEEDEQPVSVQKPRTMTTNATRLIIDTPLGDRSS